MDGQHKLTLGRKRYEYDKALEWLFSSLKYTARLNFSASFTVTVGEGTSKSSFLLHDDVFSRQSLFFRAALSKNSFRESRERAVTLPMVAPSLFSTYVQWVYSGDIVTTARRDADVAGRALREQLVELFVLGEYLVDVRLRNAVVDRYVFSLHSCGRGPAVETVCFLYASVHSSSKLLAAVRDWYLCYASGSWLELHQHELPGEFFSDLTIGWAKVRDGSKTLTAPVASPQCTYHEHGEESPFCE